jgi:hypothetical protein
VDRGGSIRIILRSDCQHSLKGHGFTACGKKHSSENSRNRIAPGCLRSDPWIPSDGFRYPIVWVFRADFAFFRKLFSRATRSMKPARL